ncbi:MAG: hypothetical protein JNG84_05520 [Archangium sp.]|nr:hypothetical protein [Archangium sp.]
MKTALKMGVLAVVAALGCNQLTAKHVAVATLLATPAIQFPPEAIAQPDGGFFNFDAGGFTIEMDWDGGITIPAESVASLFFGLRPDESPASIPDGIEGAKVTLSEAGGGSWQLKEGGLGSYSLALDDGGFAYKDTATYSFTMEQGGASYVAKIERVPSRENIGIFHPAAGYMELTAGQAVTFTRPEPSASEDRPVAFITVFPISRFGQKLTPTYTTFPKAPVDFLKLVLSPAGFRANQVSIPGSAFPQGNSNYLIVLQTAKLGGPASDNLFTGSAILAGTSEVGIVKTK